MRIIKTSSTQITPEQGQIVNAYTESNTNTYSCNYVNNTIKEVYSTTEVKTNKVWIDGKPIYRIVKTGITEQLSNTWNNVCLINDLNIDIITDCTLYAVYQNKTTRQGGFFFRISGNYLQAYGITGYGGFSNKPVVIEYTKTTD